MEDGNVIWRVFQRNLCCISLIVLLLNDKGARMLELYVTEPTYNISGVR